MPRSKSSTREGGRIRADPLITLGFPGAGRSPARPTGGSAAIPGRRWAEQAADGNRVQSRGEPPESGLGTGPIQITLEGCLGLVQASVLRQGLDRACWEELTERVQAVDEVG